MKAHKQVVKLALDKGYTISVFDGEEWSTKKSNKYSEIIKDIEGVDESKIKIHAEHKDHIAWVVLDSGNDTIQDHTGGEFFDDWEEKFVF